MNRRSGEAPRERWWVKGDNRGEVLTVNASIPSPSPSANEVWPPLAQAAWTDTCATLQLWMQVVGKIRLALMPHVNHAWNVTLYPTVRGLTTAPLPHGNRMLQIDFDFLDHRLRVETSDGARESFALEPMTVAMFYRRVMDSLDRAGTPVRIWTTPVELPNPIPFEKDTQHHNYDAVFVERFGHILLQTTRVFTEYRARFLGKVSPIHLILRA